MNKLDPNYHLVGEMTILKELNIDLVKTFPLDYMHLVCLGVKKIFLLWVENAPINLRISRVKPINGPSLTP